jgi:tRNA dimethylallyltransferase
MCPFFLLGCTAVGKGEIGFRLAQHLGAELISLDSMKVYRGLDIGTAKPSAEKRRRVRYHMLDIADPTEPFSTGHYFARASAAAEEIVGRGKMAIFLGGTALYYKRLTSGLAATPRTPAAIRAAIKAEAESKGTVALHAELSSIDPPAAAAVHPNDLRRISRALEVFRATGRRFSDFLRETPPPIFSPGSYKTFCLRRSREDLCERIDIRVDMMFDKGLVDEVRALLSRPGGLGPTASQALGYKEVIAMLQEGRAEIETRTLVKRKTRNFARRQMTWFRSFKEVVWVDVDRGDPPAETARFIGAQL